MRSAAPNSLSANIQICVKNLLDKVKDFIDVKVRIKDPLDDNDHLIVSSRGNMTPKTVNKQISNCKSSARLDKAFIQNSSRSNINLVSARNATTRRQ